MTQPNRFIRLYDVLSEPTDFSLHMARHQQILPLQVLRLNFHAAKTLITSLQQRTKWEEVTIDSTDHLMAGSRWKPAQQQIKRKQDMTDNIEPSKPSKCLDTLLRFHATDHHPQPI